MLDETIYTQRGISYLSVYLLPSLILRSTVKCNKVKHLPHTGPDSVAVVIFEFGG